jgi:hypothetical protein
LAHAGGFQSAAAFTHGMQIAVYIGSGIVGFGAVAAGFAYRRRDSRVAEPALSGSAG